MAAFGLFKYIFLKLYYYIWSYNFKNVGEQWTDHYQTEVEI